MRLDTGDKHVVVVLGMHRSGTSALTRGLQVLGVSLGGHLMPAQPDNQKGFWEDLDINVLNIDLLAALGHDWHTLTPVLPKEFAAPAVDEMRLRAVNILRSRLELADCLGLKDPRMARLLPFWQDVFGRLQVRVSYLLACRNPVSVASSLARRDGFDREKSYFLWLEHVLRSLEQTAGQPRLVVDYDRLLQNPAAQLQRVARKLGFKFDRESPQFADFENFLEESLCHHRHGPNDLQLDSSIPVGVSELYELLMKLASDEVSIDDPGVTEKLNRVATRHRQDSPALAYMRRWEEKATKLAEQLGYCDRQIAELSQSVTHLNQLLAHRDRQIAELTQTAGVLNHEVSDLKAQLNVIFNSRSWKIARALHKGAQPLKRLFRPS